PLAGFLLLGLVLFLAGDEVIFTPWPVFVGFGDKPLVFEAISDLIWINLAWGIFNLFPIWPLDGGQISRDFLGWVSRENGVKVAYGISMVLAGLLALHALMPEPLVPGLPSAKQGYYSALLFGSLAFNSFQALQFERQRKPWDSQGDDW